MDFDDTPDEAAFRAEVRSFLDANASLRTGTDADWSRGAMADTPAAQAEYLRHCREWVATLFDHGWAGITWPTAFGGRGGRCASAGGLLDAAASRRLRGGGGGLTAEQRGQQQRRGHAAFARAQHGNW